MMTSLLAALMLTVAQGDTTYIQEGAVMDKSQDLKNPIADFLTPRTITKVELKDDGTLVVEYQQVPRVYEVYPMALPQGFTPPIDYYRDIYGAKDGRIVLLKHLHRVEVSKTVLKEVEEIEYKWEE